MKNWNFKAIGIGCGAVAVLVIARLSVSLGRLFYSLQTVVNVFGGDVLPSWQAVLLEDGFFYIGLLALAGCVLSAIMCRRNK